MFNIVSVHPYASDKSIKPNQIHAVYRHNQIPIHVLYVASSSRESPIGDRSSRPLVTIPCLEGKSFVSPASTCTVFACPKRPQRNEDKLVIQVLRTFITIDNLTTKLPVIFVRCICRSFPTRLNGNYE